MMPARNAVDGNKIIDRALFISKYLLMGRPSTISTKQILETARELFLTKGPGVTTAEIAREVGISEASIFKRFPTKHALFHAALGFEDQHEVWEEELTAMVGCGDLKKNLVQIAVARLAFFRQLIPRLMVMWTCREDMQAHMQKMHGPDSPPRKGLEALTRYFKAEMALGRIRVGDPEVVGRIFIGFLFNLIFMETIGATGTGETTGRKGSKKWDPEAHARALVETLWAGIDPASEGAPTAARPPRKKA